MLIACRQRHGAGVEDIITFRARARTATCQPFIQIGESICDKKFGPQDKPFLGML